MTLFRADTGVESYQKTKTKEPFNSQNYNNFQKFVTLVAFKTTVRLSDCSS